MSDSYYVECMCACIVLGEEVDSTYICHSYIELLIVQGCVVCEGVLCVGVLNGRC